MTLDLLALPETAAADSYSGGPWSNNGCKYSAIAWDQGGEWGASGQVWNFDLNYPCSGGWVQIHYSDAKGANQVVSTVSTWQSNGGAATVLAAGQDTSIRYACFSAKSASAGNWSVVRKLGSGAGACGHP